MLAIPYGLFAALETNESEAIVMKFELRAFQETAVIQTRKNINKAMRNKKEED